MCTAYLTGFSVAVRRWPVVLILFAATVVWALGFAAMSWNWLAAALDNSLATRTLLTDLDMNVFIDLSAYHAEGFWMLMQAGVILAVLFALIGIWLNATAVVAAAGGAPTLDCVRGGLSLFSTYLQLWIVIMLLNGGAVAGAALLGRGLSRWMTETTHDGSFYWAAGAIVVVTAFLLVFFTTLHDHARVQSALTGKGGMSALVWAFRFTTQREWRALPLSMLLLANGLIAWAVYQSLARLIAADSTTGVLLSMLWGELLLLARMLLRMWTFGAAVTLQKLEGQGQGWRS